MRLPGKVAVVTGGVKGIGRSLVERLLHEGMYVAALDVDHGGLEVMLAELKEAYSDKWGRLHCLYCDVRNADDVFEVIDYVAGLEERVDVLVNNAGRMYSAPLIGIDAGGVVQHPLDAWRSVIDVNLSGVFYMTRAVIEKMVRGRTRGVIVNVSSVCAAGNAGQSAYSAAKAGVDALTCVWAKELAPWGIRVVGIAPGFTETEGMWAATTEAVREKIISEVLVGRLGRPEEIVDGIVFALQNGFVNGTVLHVDGGLVI